MVQLPIPPKQRRSETTLLRLLEAVRELIADRDYDDVSVEEICQHALVSKSSFYARFPSKAALLQTLFEVYRQEALDTQATTQAKALAATTVEDIWYEVSYAFWNHVWRNASLLKCIERAPFSEQSMVDFTNLEPLVLLMQWHPASRHLDPARVHFAGTCLRAIALRMGFARLEPEGMTHDQFVRQCARMATLYVEAPDPEAP